MPRHREGILPALAITLLLVVPHVDHVAGGEASVTRQQRAEREQEAARILELRVLEWAQFSPSFLAGHESAVNPVTTTRVEGGIELVFGADWSTPVEIEGEGIPAVTFRNGRIRLIDGRVRFSEGLEATISTHPYSTVQYTFANGRWRLRGFGAVVGG